MAAWKVRARALFALAAVLTAAITGAQSTPRSRYRILSTDAITQTEVDKVTRAGYRLVLGGAPVTPAFIVLERTGQRQQYFVSEALFEDIRDHKIPSGYRILPQSIAVRVGRHSRRVGDGTCSAIFERSAGDDVSRDYRVEYAQYLKNLRKDISKAASDGYRALAVGAGCAVLERTMHTPRAGTVNSGDTPAHLLIELRTLSAFEQETRAAVARGYRLQSVFQEAREILYLWEYQGVGAPRADYRLLFAGTTPMPTWTERLEQLMNEAAATGYRLHPLSFGALRYGFAAVMERRESPAVEYRVIRDWAGSRLAFERQLIAAGEEGWEFVAVMGASVAVMQRAAP